MDNPKLKPGDIVVCVRNSVGCYDVKGFNKTINKGEIFLLVEIKAHVDLFTPSYSYVFIKDQQLFTSYFTVHEVANNCFVKL